MSFVLDLDADGSSRNPLIRIPPPLPGQPFNLRLVIAFGSEAVLAGKCVCKTNLPGPAKKFNRKVYYEHQFLNDPSIFGSDYICNIPVHQSGSFDYMIEFIDVDSGLLKWASRKGHIIVDPLLLLKTPSSELIEDNDVKLQKVLDFLPHIPFHWNGQSIITLDSICLLTLVPKWMGTIDCWHKHLQKASETGYNMIHFVPMQERGASNSPYSIKDQLNFSTDLFISKDVKSSSQKDDLVRSILEKSKKEYGLLFITDVVWNHTSFDSVWLKHHPDSGYNLVNSPHLRIAFELDEAILKFSDQETAINTMADVDSVIHRFHDFMKTELKLWEFYVLDVEKELSLLDSINSHDCISTIDEVQLRSIIDSCVTNPHGRRLSKSFNRILLYDKLDNIQYLRTKETYRKLLMDINLIFYQDYDRDIITILNNIKSRVIYERIEQTGPKLGNICKRHPLVESYFSRLTSEDLHIEPDSLILANNGWIWNGDSLVDFAGPSSKSYLLREVIPWGDCVKLRYGASKNDAPFLWKHMEEYSRKMASMFDGFRIDNCHSTPIHVAKYLLDSAREVNPNLYVVAELFTGSEEKDLKFVCELGINSLIRESMSAWDNQEFSRIIHKYGGDSVGSFCLNPNFTSPILFYQNPTSVIRHKGSAPHALLMECTHDNQTPFQRRTVHNFLSNSAASCMTISAFGSVKGYDEIYPRLLDIVNETRLYSDTQNGKGLTDVKKMLLRLHYYLAQNNFMERHVDQRGDILSITRYNPIIHEGFLLITHAAFHKSPVNDFETILSDIDMEFIFHASFCEYGTYLSDESNLTGMPCFVDFEFASTSYHIENNAHEGKTILHISTLQPGDVIMFKFRPTKSSLGSIKNIESLLRVDFMNSRDRDDVSDLLSGISPSVEALNCILFKVEPEEFDSTGGDSVYNIPGYGYLTYAGFAGWIFPIQTIIHENDVGHALCNHLRDGVWPIHFMKNRLDRYAERYPHLGLDQIAKKLHGVFQDLEKLPKYLRARFFCMSMDIIYQEFVKIFYIKNGGNKKSQLEKALYLNAVEFLGNVPSTGLDPVSKNSPCISAGLPHFSTHHMRCWGRDIFICLKGLYMDIGLFDIARAHIVAFASCLRHGLIPNLLDSGRRPRYNARDATWFFLQAIQDYVSTSPDGIKFLDLNVKMRFPNDSFVDHDSDDAFSRSMSIREIVQEIMQRHFDGIHFVEWNAGPQLDHAMKTEGFQIDIYTDKTTGFIFGGNTFNCGTWMDKMGESENSGNHGIPATPRSGAAIEIIGLLKSTVNWLKTLADQNDFPVGVLSDCGHFSYCDWNELLQKSFEKFFFIPESPEKDHLYTVDPLLLNRRGIYKDTVSIDCQKNDYCLRPNFVVALSVAPELFVFENAQKALSTAYNVLMGPLGVKTLDPEDSNYRGNYNNSNNSDDYFVSKGFNYHQGPEWLWLAGLLLRECLRWKVLAPHEVYPYLKNYMDEIKSNRYMGLPELTNENGSYCKDSCSSQAWSAATVLQLLKELSK